MFGSLFCYISPGFHKDQDCDVDVENSISNDHSCSDSVYSFVDNVFCSEDCSYSMVSPSSPLCTPMASYQVSYSVAFTNYFSSLAIEHDYPSEDGPSLDFSSKPKRNIPDVCLEMRLWVSAEEDPKGEGQSPLCQG